MPLNEKQIATLKELKKEGYGHASNILHKDERKKKGKSKDKDQDVALFYEEYEMFSNAIENSSTDIANAVEALNRYKDFVKEYSEYKAQSKFDSTIVEEFICRVLKNKFGDNELEYGGIEAYSSMYFSYSNLENFKAGGELKFNLKDQDVAIYRKLDISSSRGKKYSTLIPIVCIECKTYLDKTMYEGIVATASKIKAGNPRCLFLIVTETYDVDGKVDVELSEIDNIYVLRQQKRKNNKQKSIQLDVVEHLLDAIEKHMTKDKPSTEEMIKKGYLIP